MDINGGFDAEAIMYEHLSEELAAVAREEGLTSTESIGLETDVPVDEARVRRLADELLRRG